MLSSPACAETEQPQTTVVGGGRGAAHISALQSQRRLASTAVPQRSEDLILRAEALIANGDAVIATHRADPPNVIGFATLDSGAFTEWQTQTLAFLIRVLGKDHVYV